MSDSGGDEKASGSTTVVGEMQPRAAWFSSEAGSIRVEVVGGPMDGLCGRAQGPNLVLGRAETNDLALALDPMVSKCHASITREGEHYWLRDLGSSNGTYLGDERIQGRMLIGPGTMFVVGSTAVEFTRD